MAKEDFFNRLDSIITVVDRDTDKISVPDTLNNSNGQASDSLKAAPINKFKPSNPIKAGTKTKVVLYQAIRNLTFDEAIRQLRDKSMVKFPNAQGLIMTIQNGGGCNKFYFPSDCPIYGIDEIDNLPAYSDNLNKNLCLTVMVDKQGKVKYHDYYAQDGIKKDDIVIVFEKCFS